MLYYAFEILYWCGIREGRAAGADPCGLLILRKKRSASIKSYQQLQGKDVITTPKTKKSNRVIQMPDFLCDEIQDYFKQLYGLESDSRIFHYKYALEARHGVWLQGVGCQVCQNPRFEAQPRSPSYQHGLFRRCHRLLIAWGTKAWRSPIGTRICSQLCRKMADKLNVEGVIENVTEKPRQPKPLAQQDCCFPGITGGRCANRNLCQALRGDEARTTSPAA